MAYQAPAAAAPEEVVAAKRQPILVPGFADHIQLSIGFSNVKFGPSWLRRNFTDEYNPSLQARLAADEPSARERRLTEACYLLRGFYGSRSLWAAISRFFAVRPDVAESVVDLYVDARAVYLKNDGNNTGAVKTEATYWADKWTSFLDRPFPIQASDSEVYAAVDDFFNREKARNVDLAGILSKGIDVDRPSAPRALRKRSPSPTTSWTPNAKKRMTSRSKDEHARNSASAGTRTISQSSFHSEQAYHKTAFGTPTPGSKFESDQASRRSQDEPYFELKIRGQAQRDNRKSLGYRNQHWSDADDGEALARSNMELQDRVYFLERERLEAARAQKDRDDAIRGLQAKFVSFEKTSAAADVQSSVNDRLLREMREVVNKLGTQAERLQKMEKRLEISDQAAEKMQATISSLQKEIEQQARPVTEKTGVAATQAKTGKKGAAADIKKEVSELHVRMMSLEAKSVFFNDLHKSVRELKAELVAQTHKLQGMSSIPGPAGDQAIDGTCVRLKAVEEKVERQGQAAHVESNRVTALQDQAIVRNARITSLEGRRDTAKDISRAESRLSVMEQDQIIRSKDVVDRFDAVEVSIKGAQNRLNTLEVERLPLLEITAERLSQVQAKIAEVEEHGAETSKRLDDMEVAQDALTLLDQSSRVDEVSRYLESLETLIPGLARNADMEILKSELKFLSQKQAASSQPTSQTEAALASVTSMIQSLSKRIATLDNMFKTYITEHPTMTENTLRNGKRDDAFAVIDSLCKRVSIMENGFHILRDAMFGPWR